MLGIGDIPFNNPEPVHFTTISPDPINHPPHYTKGAIEVLDFILDQQFSYLEGQVVKYICRYKFKGSRLQDLQKAEFYLKRLIQQEQNGK